MPLFYEHSNIEERDNWIRLLNNWADWDASDAYIFGNKYLKYLFANFLSTFSSFQCLNIVIFEQGIVLSNSYDGWDKRGYTIWFNREGTPTLLNCIWLYLKGVPMQHTWTLWVSTFKSWNCMKLNLLRKFKRYIS